mgnify:CR=1 FL=1
MKKYILMLCAALGLTACMNDWDKLNADATVFTAENVGEPNTTIAEVKARFASQIQNGDAKATAQVKEDLIIEGIVTGNDLSGNIYQAIYVQDVKSDGSADTENGGIQVCIKGIGKLAAVFPVGQKIRMNLKGLYVSGYGKMAKVGQPYVTASTTNPTVRIGPMAQNVVERCIQLVGKPEADKALARKFTSADLNSIDKLTPMLVVIEGAKLADADGTATYAPQSTGAYSVERKLQLSDGKSVVLYNSCSADFASEVMPQGKVTVYGIMTRYNTTWQLLLRSVEDVKIEN